MFFVLTPLAKLAKGYYITHIKHTIMQLVIKYKNQVTTTSVLVAEKFEREHKTVLRSIQNLECTDDFREHNFVLSSYKSVQNRDLPMYIITRDGFTMLMMSFTGAAAAKFREEFIEEFNRMEAVIRQGETPVLIPTYQTRILSEPTKLVPKGFWSIFDESHSIMLFVEKNIGSVNKFDLVDGSIGIRWSQYRKGKEWATNCSTYTHQYCDVRGEQECKCYAYTELQHFKEWLKGTYKPMHLYDYLHGKYTNERNRIMLDKVEELLPKLLSAS